MERKRILSPEEKRKIAFHEAGHTLIGWFLQHIDPVIKVIIITFIINIILMPGYVFCFSFFSSLLDR